VSDSLIEESNSNVDSLSDEEIEASKTKEVRKPKQVKKSTKLKDNVAKNKASCSKPSIELSNGWDSKKVAIKSGGNQNFRAFNLKPKKGGGSRASGASRFGKNKFQKTKKLSSYNYEKSDGNYLVAGYDENEEEGIDTISTNFVQLKESDILKFILIDPVDPSNELCEISPKYGVKEKTFVDLNQALKTLTGYEKFRQGQEGVIRRILAYDSTLLILPTGSGKSLCFQLPAFILRHVSKAKHSMVMVVSPTISLMMDQMACLPPGLRGACLSSADQKV
jgi:hypothetical protein